MCSGDHVSLSFRPDKLQPDIVPYVAVSRHSCMVDSGSSLLALAHSLTDAHPHCHCAGLWYGILEFNVPLDTV